MRGQYQIPCKITLDEFGKKYVEYAKTNKRSWVRDVQMLNHIQEFFGNRMLSEITAAEVEEYKSYRCGMVKQSTVNRELTLMKRLFNLASAWDFYNGKNPVCKVRFFREDNIRLRTLSLTGKIRNVPINDVTRKILNYWLLGRRNGFVFCNPDTGKQFRNLKAGFKSACKKTGIYDGIILHTSIAFYFYSIPI
jgi:hypothetical protein